MPNPPPFGRTRIKKPEIQKPLLVVNDANGQPMIDEDRYVAFNVSTGGYILALGKKRTYLGREHGRAVEAFVSRRSPELVAGSGEILRNEDACPSNTPSF